MRVLHFVPLRDEEAEKPILLLQVSPTTLLQALSSADWLDPLLGAQVEPLALPPMTCLLLADVDAGSHTPSMVGKVLQWKKNNPEQGAFPYCSLRKYFPAEILSMDQATEIWQTIGALNTRLRGLIEQLTKKFRDDPSGYAQALDKLTDRKPQSAVAVSATEPPRTTDSLFQELVYCMKVNIIPFYNSAEFPLILS